MNKKRKEISISFLFIYKQSYQENIRNKIKTQNTVKSLKSHCKLNERDDNNKYK